MLGQYRDRQEAGIAQKTRFLPGAVLIQHCPA
jgi:hypothetical protein